ELKRADGFSPGAAALLWMPTVDLGRSGAPGLIDIARSLDADSPVVVMDARTGKRWPVYAELDMNSPEGGRALVVRPAVNYVEGHRYVIAVRHLVDGAGVAIPASAAFASHRHGPGTADAAFEARPRALAALLP